MTEKRFIIDEEKIKNNHINYIQVLQNLLSNEGLELTEKRFKVTQTVLGSGIYDYQAENELCESYDEDAYGKVVKLLNELHEENQRLKFQLEECKHNKLFSRRELEEQNKELKERNNRQCRQLDKLYKLIEKQDWETLTGIIQELKEADERLQKEWSEIE